jgi:TRAP-type uncharacterized transport system substrate-binding protein
LHVELPAGTLPSQDEPLGIGANRGFAAVHSTFEDEKAYKVVMAIASIGEQMVDLHALWKIWSPELMTCGLSEENTHSGAVRAYKELGWWDKAANCQPMTYPE